MPVATAGSDGRAEVVPRPSRRSQMSQLGTLRRLEVVWTGGFAFEGL